MEMLRHFDQNCGLTPLATQPNDIDERSFGGLQASRITIADIQFLTPEIESLSSENMNIDRRTQCGNSVAPWNGNIDLGWPGAVWRQTDTEAAAVL
jgi:hypothetical protein